MSKHVLITGGMGFIGHVLTRQYLDEGFKVTIVDNLNKHHQHPALTKYRMEYVDHKKLSFIQSNCSLTFSIRDKLDGLKPRSIIHLASHPNQRAVMEEKFIATSQMNSNTFTVAEFAEEIGARMVYVSSSMAYGNFTRMPMPENEPLKPINLYGMLKAHGEDLAKLACDNTVIVRPSAVYGPGDNINRVLGTWINALLNNKDIAVLNPASLLDFTHVNDLARGIRQAEEHGVAGEVYNLTRGEARSLAEAAYLVHKTIGSLGLVHISEQKPSDEPQRGALDISKAQEHLGYRPKIDFTNGVKQYVDWMRNYSHVY
jgi:nucleoside-diphosphate-sugar epimerase